MKEKYVTGKVIATTHDGDNDLASMFAMGGKFGGICYMSGDYDDVKVSGTYQGFKRAMTTSSNGHHSVFDHVNITVEFNRIPKIIAMFLNSLGNYTTSEKSGRYTIMSALSDHESKLYDKWLARFTHLINEKYPDMTDREVKTAARENARYVLSVFSPTKMAYTTSLRMWAYIKQWCEKFKQETEVMCEHETFGDSWFRIKIMDCLSDLAELIESLNIYAEEIKDNKFRGFEFWDINGLVDSKEYFGDTFKAVYDASFVMLAHSHRHRTLKHIMHFDGKPKKFYIPAILKGTKFEQEWLTDLSSSMTVPQATIIEVVERGNTEDYIMKLQERLCGRVLLETLEITKDTYLKMMQSDDMSEGVKSLLGAFMDEDGKILPRCKSGLFKCTEGCRVANKIYREI